MTNSTVAPSVSDYDRVGGAPTVRLVVEQFYELVLADQELAGYFEGIDVAHLKRHQVLLLSQVLGGPAGYEGRDLAEAHRHLRIPAAHFDRVGLFLTGVLWKAGADSDIILRVHETLAAVRPQIVAPEAAVTGRRRLGGLIRRLTGTSCSCAIA